MESTTRPPRIGNATIRLFGCATGRARATLGTTRGAMERQRGFTLLEMTVTLMVLSMLVLATATAFGARVPRARPAQLALAAALAQARGVAMSTGDATNPVVPTGATVTVDVDPTDGAGSTIRVFRSRPIVYGGPGLGAGSKPAPLVPDGGLALARVKATFHIDDSNPKHGNSDRPFTILISHSGYASVLAGYAYDPVRNNVWTKPDPGCTEGGVTIVADDLRVLDSAGLSCRDGQLLAETVTYAP